MDLDDAVRDAKAQADAADAYRAKRHAEQRRALEELGPQVPQFLDRMKAHGNPGVSRISVRRRNWRGKMVWTGAKGWPLYGSSEARVRGETSLLTDGRFVTAGQEVRVEDLLASDDEQKWGGAWHSLADSARGITRALAGLLVEHGVDSPGGVGAAR